MAPSKDDIVAYVRELHDKGYTPGTSGGLAVLCNFGSNSKSIFVTPEGINKKKIQTGELFVLRDFYGAQEFIPPLDKDDNAYLISRYTPIFLDIIKDFNASCVAYLPSKWATLATRMGLKAWSEKAESLPNVVRLSHWSLLEDLSPGKHEIIIPVIDPGSIDAQVSQIKQVIRLYPETVAVFVRNKGMVVWEDSFDKLQSKIELLERVCELQVYEFHLLGK